MKILGKTMQTTKPATTSTNTTTTVTKINTIKTIQLNTKLTTSNIITTIKINGNSTQIITTTRFFTKAHFQRNATNTKSRTNRKINLHNWKPRR
jgi:hypothetical protein